VEKTQVGLSIVHPLALSSFIRNWRASEDCSTYTLTYMHRHTHTHFVDTMPVFTVAYETCPNKYV